MIFVSDPDPIFHLVHDPYQDLVPDLDPVLGPTLIFLIQDISFLGNFY